MFLAGVINWIRQNDFIRFTYRLNNSVILYGQRLAAVIKMTEPFNAEPCVSCTAEINAKHLCSLRILIIVVVKESAVKGFHEIGDFIAPIFIIDYIFHCHHGGKPVDKRPYRYDRILPALLWIV